MKIRALTPLICLISLFLLVASDLNAQQTNTQIAIKTSIVCEMCQKNIERALAFKGMEKLDVNLKTQLVTVSFDPQQTTPEKIKSAISKAGYDADEVKANPKAYKKLAKCCKKENVHP